MRHYARLCGWLLVVTCAGFVSPSVASSQDIVSYEFSIGPQTGGPAVKVLTAPAVNVTCVIGRAPTVSTVWLQPTDPWKVLFEPDLTRVCTWNGPAVSTLGLANGTKYTAIGVAVNEAGLRSVGSAPSNPFGVAGAPPPLLRLTVPGGG